MINTWLKFEVKIQNDSKVTVFTRNHTDDDDDKGTKNNIFVRFNYGLLIWKPN